MTPKDIANRALSENDPAILDQLLALPQAHLVVDGYNVTKTGYPQMPLEKQRLRLLGQLSQLAAQTGAEMTCVFDGAELVAPWCCSRRRAGCGCCSPSPASPPTS
ncbi:NYN domain-containing protein [Streptomyces violaceorubidus]